MNVKVLRAEFDEDALALYIKFEDAEVAETVELKRARVLADIGESGEVVGIEVLLPKCEHETGKVG